MKRLALTTVLILTLVSFTGSAFAQSKSAEKCRKDKVWNCEAVENLKIGIASENTGLRRSSIYLAGQYELTELKSTLVKQLKKEEDRSIRILIALSLHKMGNPDAAIVIGSLAMTDNDMKVRRICTAIYDDLMTGSYQKELAALTRR